MIYMLFMFALFNMSELYKNRDRIDFPIASQIDVIRHPNAIRQRVMQYDNLPHAGVAGGQHRVADNER